jgi:hypothetical protein
MGLYSITASNDLCDGHRGGPYGKNQRRTGKAGLMAFGDEMKGVL